jgi:opacity protein-like surface antigen
MVFKRVSWLVTLATLAFTMPAYAQDPRAEISVLLGWTISDGIDGDAIRAPDGETYNSMEPKDSFNWRLMGGVLLGDYGNAEVGFMYGQQLSTLRISGTRDRDLGDLTVSTYHGYFGYNFFDNEATVRPYLFGGLGATSFGGVDFERIDGTQGHINGETQFSTTWGAGVKFYASPNVGARFGIQWTPTYIKSDPAGYWCDPWYGWCYLVGDPQYSSQLDFSGGILFRF